MQSFTHDTQFLKLHVVCLDDMSFKLRENLSFQAHVFNVLIVHHNLYCHSPFAAVLLTTVGPEKYSLTQTVYDKLEK